MEKLVEGPDCDPRTKGGCQDFGADTDREYGGRNKDSRFRTTSKEWMPCNLVEPGDRKREYVAWGPTK